MCQSNDVFCVLFWGAENVCKVSEYPEQHQLFQYYVTIPTLQWENIFSRFGFPTRQRTGSYRMKYEEKFL